MLGRSQSWTPALQYFINSTYMSDAVSFSFNLKLPISMNFIQSSVPDSWLKVYIPVISCPSSIIKQRILENTRLGSTGVGGSRLTGQASKLLTRPAWKSLRLVNSWRTPWGDAKSNLGTGEEVIDQLKLPLFKRSCLQDALRIMATAKTRHTFSDRTRLREKFG